MHFGYITVPLGALLLWMAFHGLRHGYGEPGNTAVVYRTVIGLVAGGLFTRLDSGTSTTNIARWDGTIWHAFGTGLGGGACRDVEIASSGDVYASGLFSFAGGQQGKL